MVAECPLPAIDEAEADRRLAADRRDVAALVAKADHLLAASDLKRANAFYGAALQVAGADLPQREIARIRQTMESLARRMRQALFDTLDAEGFPAERRSERVQKSLEIMLGLRARDSEERRYPQQPQNFYLADTDYCEFAQANQFVWGEALRAAAPRIRAEARALMADGESFAAYVKRDASRPQGDVHGMLENTDWSTFDLTRGGEPIPERVARCPVTWQTVSEHAPLCRIRGRAPSVMFSLLRPHSRIPPHTGVMNARLICHLPLLVPPGCGFRVGSETREWREGELMVFDDTVEHEAWNDGDENRLVLIFDIWRPELSESERAQVQAIFAAVDAV